MSRLLLLPQELLENIVNHLPAAQDISHLSLTCKDAHTRTTKTLYKSITFEFVFEGNKETREI
jgi:hypothetical protein